MLIVDVLTLLRFFCFFPLHFELVGLVIYILYVGDPTRVVDQIKMTPRYLMEFQSIKTYR